MLAVNISSKLSKNKCTSPSLCLPFSNRKDIVLTCIQAVILAEQFVLEQHHSTTALTDFNDIQMGLIFVALK